MEQYEAWVREYWPLLVGVAIIVVGNIYYYGVLGHEWAVVGPALMVAVVVVVAIEIGRAAYRRMD